MISDAINTLQKITDRARQIERVLVPGAAQGTLYFRVGEELRTVTLPPPRNVLQLERIASLGALIGGAAEPPENAAVFVTADEIVYFADMTDTLAASASIALVQSDELSALLGITPEGISNITLRALLRFRLRDALPDDTRAALLAQISSIVWTQNTSGHMRNDREGESIGREITASLQGAAGNSSLPETVFFRPRRWAADEIRDIDDEIEFALEPDHARQKFLLFPFQNSLNAYYDGTLNELGERVRAAVGKIPVYVGDLKHGPTQG